MKTIKTDFGKELIVHEALPPEELKKHDKADDIEERVVEERMKLFEKFNKRSIQSKIIIFYEPKFLLAIQAITSAIYGLCFPLFARLIARVMSLLTAPLENFGGPEQTLEKILQELKILFIVACIASVTKLLQQLSQSILSNNMTFKFRLMLYENLLQKNIGWFDFKENGTGHLTDVM